MGKNVIIIGSGISGLSAAIEGASLGIHVTLISPYASERAQSVMAAGGINGVMDASLDNDSIESHVEDTYKGGVFLESREALESLCQNAPEHIRFLEQLGVVFSRDKKGGICQRAFGGQCHRRTAYAGASTGKQIVTALIRKCREYEIKGQIERIVGLHFHSAMILDNHCYGVWMMNALSGELQAFYADAVIMATGGQNKLFGKTTGTEICDGFAAGTLFTQGVTLRNLEFIQYHPTTIETSHKRMLITEAARGEGGRLYYLQDGKRVYFMEDKYGEKGNLMPRDVVSKCIYDCPSQVYLDIAFLGRDLILERLREVYDLCLDYLNLDVTKESIPVAPSVHFFMGGIAVDVQHKTNVDGLYAVGECASIYHGANRLGGNSLLAAVHSGRTAARAIAESGKKGFDAAKEVFGERIKAAQKEMNALRASKSMFPAAYLLKDLAEVMNTHLGITRTEEGLMEGLSQVEYYLNVLSKMNFDPQVSVYENHRLLSMFLLAKAILLSALSRKETRGAHIREDYPVALSEYEKCSYITYNQGNMEIELR